MGPQTFYHAMLTMLRLAERWQIRRLVGRLYDGLVSAQPSKISKNLP